MERIVDHETKCSAPPDVYNLADHCKDFGFCSEWDGKSLEGMSRGGTESGLCLSNITQRKRKQGKSQGGLLGRYWQQFRQKTKEA